MGKIFNRGYISKLILASSLLTCSIAMMPSNGYSSVNQIDDHEFQFAHRMQRLFEEINEATDASDSDQLFELMLETKRELELKTGRVIDVDEKIDQVKSKLKKKRNKISKNVLKKIRKKIKKKEEKLQHRAIYLEQCYLANMPYTIEEAQLHYAAQYEDLENDDDKVVVSTAMEVGATVALVGSFIEDASDVLPQYLNNYASEMFHHGIEIATETDSLDDN